MTAANMDGIFFDPEHAQIVSADVAATGGGAVVFEPIGSEFAILRGAANLERDYCLMPYVRQVLPGLQEITFGSISKAADAVVQWLFERDCKEPWALLMTALSCHRRARLIEEAIISRAKQAARLRKLYRKNATEPGVSLVQVVLRDEQNLFVSWVNAAAAQRYGSAMVPYAEGKIPLRIDRDAPARAFQKLVEAEERFGLTMKEGQTVVDLGACPGGWTYVAVQRGASVLAIDRAPLRDDLLRHPKVTWQKGDVFTYAPDRAVDHLICDVIALPERTLELLERWIVERWCRSFVVTLKFKGAPRAEIISRAQDLVRNYCIHGGLQRLGANKNEVTVMGVVRTDCGALG